MVHSSKIFYNCSCTFYFSDFRVILNIIGKEDFEDQKQNKSRETGKCPYLCFPIFKLFSQLECKLLEGQYLFYILLVPTNLSTNNF